MVINEDALDDYDNATSKVDLIGHNLIDSSRSNLNFLSYISPITEELTYTGETLISDEDVDYVCDCIVEFYRK